VAAQLAPKHVHFINKKLIKIINYWVWPSQEFSWDWCLYQYSKNVFFTFLPPPRVSKLLSATICVPPLQCSPFRCQS